MVGVNHVVKDAVGHVLVVPAATHSGRMAAGSLCASVETVDQESNSVVCKAGGHAAEESMRDNHCCKHTAVPSSWVDGTCCQALA